MAFIFLLFSLGSSDCMSPRTPQKRTPGQGKGGQDKNAESALINQSCDPLNHVIQNKKHKVATQKRPC